ncbi:MAG: segregation/condensation protein A [Desulfobacterales bacterium]|nr:segregation/condensation protein A [Desulfobacterales bacterium]
MAENLYKIDLKDVFEGPMDLLVHLIKKNEVDIYDIPIALVTDQYLQWMELMKALNVDLAGDFLVMAATLMQIKSKMLLPVHEDEEEEDPRMEIARPLLEYLQIKSAAAFLGERNILGHDTFIRYPQKDEFEPDPEDGVIRAGLFELIEAFQNILDNMAPDHRVDLSTERKTVKERISELVEVFERQESLTFMELFSDQADRGEIILTFLALLEMVKLSLVRITQHARNGVIRLFYV